MESCTPLHPFHIDMVDTTHLVEYTNTISKLDRIGMVSIELEKVEMCF
jgi:hypothetical protein